MPPQVYYPRNPSKDYNTPPYYFPPVSGYPNDPGRPPWPYPHPSTYRGYPSSHDEPNDGRQEEENLSEKRRETLQVQENNQQGIPKS